MKAIRLKLVTRSAALFWLAALLLCGFVLWSYSRGYTPGWRPDLGPWFARGANNLGPNVFGADNGAMSPLSAASLLLGAIGGLLAMPRRTRYLGLAVWLIAGAAGASRVSDILLGTEYADRITPFLGQVLAERSAGLVNHMGLNTAVSVLLCTLATLLLAVRYFALAQVSAALALSPALVSCVGYLLGVDVLFGRMPVFTLAAVLLCATAILAGTGHRGALRAILSESVPGKFARQQLLMAGLTPIAVGALFASFLPPGAHPNAVAETVVTAALVSWISIGATAMVGRRLDLARHRAEAELRILARRDPLTGLLNRRSMDAALPTRFAEARRDGAPISWLMCDLDHFKKLNDEHGHACGDQVLRRTADRISAAVRESDLVFRYGGEEIGVLLNCGAGDAIRIAEKIREAVKASGRRAGDTDLPTITISIGAATSERGETGLGPMLAAADESLYAAKDAGRDQVVHVNRP